VARRGPKERAYDDREMRAIAWNIDKVALKEEIERIRPRLEPLGQDLDALYRELTKDCHVEPKGGISPTRLTFRFLSSPKRILRDETGRVVGMEVEENTLVDRGGKLAAEGLGETTVLPVDTVVFAIGDRVDHALGLPEGGGGYATNPNADPKEPDAAKYQVFDPPAGKVLDGLFVIGWSRSASEGVVGKARLDGEKGAAVVNRFLAQRPPLYHREVYRRIGTLYHQLRRQHVPVVHKGLWRVLEQVEQERARRQGLPEFKFGTNAEMIQILEDALDRLASRRMRWVA